MPGVALAVGAVLCVPPSATAVPAAAAAAATTALFNFRQVVYNLGELQDGCGERGISLCERHIGLDELSQGGAFRRNHSSQAVEATLNVFQGCRGGVAGGRFTSAVGGERQSLSGGAAELLAFSHRLTPEELPSVRLQVNFLPPFPVPV